jgi:hypothetical protein
VTPLSVLTCHWYEVAPVAVTLNCAVLPWQTSALLGFAVMLVFDVMDTKAEEEFAVAHTPS